MELLRLKNTDTRIVFPMVDADGDPTSHADDNSPDSEWLSWDTADHGGAAPSFADCSHEIVEIEGGFYYLDAQAAEINKDFTLIRIKTALVGCKTQTILIRTYVNSNEDLHGHLAAIEADTNELQANLADGGSVDQILDGIEAHVHASDAKTANLPAQPAAVGSAMLITTGTGAGQLDVTGGVIKANLAQILGTALTESVAGYLAAGLKKLLDVASPIFTLASHNQGADNNTILADLHNTDIPAIKADTAAIKDKTDQLSLEWYSH